MEEDLLQDPEDDHPKRAVVIIFAVFFEGGLAPLSLLLGWLLGHPPLRHFVWSLEYALWGVVATIPLIALFLAILKWPIGPLARVKHFCENEVEPLLHDSSWSEIGLISLSVGVSEEMLFRGVFQEALTGWLGAPAGLGLASGSFRSAPSHFGALHGDGRISRALSRHRMDLEREPFDSHGRSHALRFRRLILSHSHPTSPPGQFQLGFGLKGASSQSPVRLVMILPVEAAMLTQMDRIRVDDAPGRRKGQHANLPCVVAR